MEMTFTGRGLEVTDEVRDAAARKLAPLQRMEPRAVKLGLELSREHHPKRDGLTRVDAVLRIPRKSFFASAEAPDALTAIDGVKEKLERQLRDHIGKRRVSKGKRAPAREEEAGQ